MKKKLKKMADFKEVKVNTPKRVVAGAAYTNLDGGDKNDWVDGDIFIDLDTGEVCVGGDGHFYC